MIVRLTLEYDGTGFAGWAAQPGLRTVEGTVREALDSAYPAWSDLFVAGRTDAGVHARGQVASFTAVEGPPFERAAEALNSHLPGDVAVLAAEEAPDDFHARFSARARTYRYRVWTRRTSSPFEHRRALWHPRPVDEERLHEIAALLPGTHDFRAFTKAVTRHQVFTRTVSEAAWERDGDALQLLDHGRQLPAAHGANARRDDARGHPGGVRTAPRGPRPRRGGNDRAAVGALPGARDLLSGGGV